MSQNQPFLLYVVCLSYFVTATKAENSLISQMFLESLRNWISKVPRKLVCWRLGPSRGPYWELVKSLHDGRMGWRKQVPGGEPSVRPQTLPPTHSVSWLPWGEHHCSTMKLCSLHTPRNNGAKWLWSKTLWPGAKANMSSFEELILDNLSQQLQVSQHRGFQRKPWPTTVWEWLCVHSSTHTTIVYLAFSPSFNQD
jgi:hypothetical protein